LFVVGRGKRKEEINTAHMHGNAEDTVARRARKGCTLPVFADESTLLSLFIYLRF
jgi:hypothetical protein